MEIKLYVKTRLITKTGKNRYLPSAYDLYTSKYVSNIRLKLNPRRSKHVAG